MLKKFSVNNFKNFKDDLVLDLSKVNNYEFSNMAIRNKIVKTALIYGENASGKSNLGYGLFDIILHLTDKEKNLNFYQAQNGTYFIYRGAVDGSTALMSFVSTVSRMILDAFTLPFPPSSPNTARISEFVTALDVTYERHAVI